MLIGGHVSTAGGLISALERAVEIGGRSMQVFNQSPRMWRPTRHTDEDLAAYREAEAGSPIEAVAIHAVYLINCASADAEIRRKSHESLVHALRLGDGIGARGVVLHPGSTVGGEVERGLELAGEAFRRALAESERCPLLLEDTAGAGDTLGRDFGELARLIELGGGGERLGVCLDCCHLLASGFEIRTPEALAAAIDELEAKVGLERLGCLHVNDSKMPLGSNRDRHANLGEGELGEAGIAAFLSEPRFEGLPAVLEVPGTEGKGPDRSQVELAIRLRERALAAR